MASLPILPSNQFSEVTDDNHSGVVWIVSLLCLVYSTLTFITRGFIKWTLLGIDDWTLVAAQVAALGQYCALFVSLHNGLGRTLQLVNDAQRQHFSRAAFGNEILVLLSLCLSKCSLIYLIRRVFTRDMKNFWFICNFFLGVVATWGLASIITVTAGCSSSHYLPPTEAAMCPGYLTRWKFVVAFDVATEVIFIILPIYLLWNLQMAFSLKVRVFLAFAFRIPVAAFSLVFLHYFSASTHALNPGVATASAISWQQIELAYALISATIPCLKSFIKSFDTGFGMGDATVTQYGYGYGSANGTIKLSSLKPGKSHNGGSKLSSHVRHSFEGVLRPEKIKNSTTIYSPGDSGKEDRFSIISKAGSQEMIIRRDVQFDVSHDYIR